METVYLDTTCDQQSNALEKSEYIRHQQRNFDLNELCYHSKLLSEVL